MGSIVINHTIDGIEWNDKGSDVFIHTHVTPTKRVIVTSVQNKTILRIAGIDKLELMIITTVQFRLY